MEENMLKRFARLFDPVRIPPKLAAVVRKGDDTISLGSAGFSGAFRDRFIYDRQTQLIEIINLCRSNPIARRIVELSTEFVIGDGFSISSPNRRVEKILKEFWEHPLNDLDTQLPEWASEAWRSGDLFILFSTDTSGRCYVRAIPAEQISEIVTAPNDYRQELYYKRSGLDEDPWPSYQTYIDLGEAPGGFVLHFPLNRMVGAAFGESDLLPVKYWIKLYQDFLENRARLNHFRQIFTYVLQRNYASQAEKDSYVRSFAAALPRKSGGILALDADESLSVVSPKLDALEAEQDGLAFKRMIATGAGLPLHYLAEPEGSTRTTAEAAGTPTFKRFKARQSYLRQAVLTVLQTALEVRRGVDPGLPARASIQVSVPDITERDNATLAMAVQRITQAFAPLYNARKISARELIRLVYKFLAETPPDLIPDETTPVQVGAGGPSLPGEPVEPA
jgi:hypothetical protein